MNPNKLLKSVLFAAALAVTIFTSVAQAKDVTVAQVKATVGYVQEYNLALLAYMQDLLVLLSHQKTIPAITV